MTDWHQRWREGQIGFHSAEVHQDLIAFENEFLGSSPKRVLVPLCGKTVDLPWLASRGHEAVGIELVPEAVTSFFGELDVTPEKSERGSLTFYRAGALTVIGGNYFDVTPADVGAIDRVWDRAALVALSREDRKRYAAHTRTLAAGATLLLNAFEYDESVMDGPPHNVPAAEVSELYGETTLLRRDDAIASADRWRELGHPYWIVSSYLIDL